MFKKETLDGVYANVESLVVGGKSDTSIDYRLHDVNGQWRVYDMVIEHVSIVSNFRAQFEREISRTSVKALIEKIKHASSRILHGCNRAQPNRRLPISIGRSIGDTLRPMFFGVGIVPLQAVIARAAIHLS